MKTLVIIDMQNDFCPGGALEVREGDLIVPIINEIQSSFDLVVATKDWHPQDHLSFASNNNKQVGDVIDLEGEDQVMWPDHCVQNTHGSEFHKDLNTSGIAKIFLKGMDRDVDSYSGFFDNGYKRASGLKEFLQEKSIDTIYIAGLALDYCVKYTALDARALGFNVYVISDATRAVALKEEDIETSIDELKQAGVQLVTSEHFRK